MKDNQKKSVEEIAKELSDVCPTKGGHREGMYYDILHVLTEERQKREEVEAEVVKWKTEALARHLSDPKIFGLFDKAEARIKELEAKLKEFKDTGGGWA